MVLSVRVREDLGAMPMKGYAILCHDFFLISYPDYLWGIYLTADMQSVYSTAPAHWAESHLEKEIGHTLLNENKANFLVFISS